MQSDLLQRLYWPCSDEIGNYANGCNLGDTYERTEATANAICHFCEVLSRLAFDSSTKAEFESIFSETMNAYEQQGFINGLRYCAQLIRELTPALEIDSSGEEART